jgi:hypothetical protein
MKVVIYDEGFIPGLGRGPFKTPIEISEDKFFLYKRMGLHIIRADKNVPIVESGIRNRKHIKKEEYTLPTSEPVKENPVIPEPVVEETIPVEEVVEETIPVEEAVEETIDEITDDAVKEETTDDVNSLDETIDEIQDEDFEEAEVDLNSLTKKELVTLLTEEGIECNSNMNKTTLLKLAEENL